MAKDIKQKALSGMIWKFLESGGTQGIQFITTIVLARLLDPTHYGVLTIITIFISIATVFINRGFSVSLVQCKDATEVDFSSVFYFSVLLSAVVYALFYAFAPWIAVYFNEPQVTASLRILALTLFFGAVTSVQEAYVMREMIFHKMFVASLVSIIISGVVGIAMAYLGFGVWALVAQQLVNRAVMCLLMYILVPWRPKWLFSFERLKKLFSFGWKLLVSGLIDTLYNDISSLIIGKRYSTESMAYYSKGKQFPQYIVTCVNNGMQTALFSTFASEQDDRARLLTMLRRSHAANAFVVFPLMAGLAAIATPMVSVVLTDKWLPSVPFLQVMCLMYAFYPVDVLNLQMINALGRSDVYLWLEILKKGVGIGILCVTVFCFSSPLVIAAGIAATCILSNVFNMFPMKRLMGYRYSDQLKDLFPPLLLSVVMGAAVYAVTLLPLGKVAMLLIQIAFGIALYVGGAWLFRMDTFYFLLRSIKEFLAKRRGNDSEITEETEK